MFFTSLQLRIFVLVKIKIEKASCDIIHDFLYWIFFRYGLQCALLPG